MGRSELFPGSQELFLPFTRLNLRKVLLRSGALRP